MKTTQNYIKNLTLLKKGRTTIPDKPSHLILEAFDNRFNHREYWIHFNCPEFTTLCPVTGQPDYGSISIQYIPDKKCIESKSLKHYLFSYRNFPSFQEEIVNRILEDVVKAAAPREIRVIGNFNARGGIAINVVATEKLND